MNDIKKPILIIDDQQENLFILEESLKAYLPGVPVISCVGAREGLRAMSSDVALVLTDMQMPDISGLELCRTIKNTPEWQHVPVLLITAHKSSTSLRVEGLQAGASDFISRPIDSRELAAKLNVCLEVRSSEDQLREEKQGLSDQVESAGYRLAEAEHRYKVLFESATDAIFLLSYEGEVLEANAEAHSLLGHRRGELVGRCMPDLIDDTGPDLSFDAMPAIGIRSVNMFFLRSDGVAVPVSVRCRIVDLGDTQAIMAIARDVTEDVRSAEVTRVRLELLQSLGKLSLEELLRKMAEELEELTESCTGYFHLYDESEKVLSMTVWSTRTEKARCAEGLGRTGFWRTCIRERQAVIHDDSLSETESNGSPGYSRPVRRELCVPVIRNGKIRGVVGVGNKQKPYGEGDVNLVSRIADLGWDIVERERARESLRIAKERAEQANRTKTEFLANMSHEIRTPLNGIMGMLQLLHMDIDEETRTEYVNLALQSTHRLTTLLSDILDISVVESGKLKIKPVRFDLQEVLMSIDPLFGLSAREKGLTLSVTYASIMTDHLYGDEQRLRQILFNLVGNALKYSNRGGVTVTADIVGKEVHGERRVLFCVSDTGVGIADEQLETVFELFGQVDQGYNREYQGAGLGLPIVKRLVELMGGSMSVKSQPDVGTAIYVSLPFKLDGPPTPLLSGQHPVVEADDAYLKALLVEDDSISRLAMRRMLQNHNIQVVECVNGKESIEALRKASFDVVFMDVQMPVMDGVQAVKAIRSGKAGDANRTIPVVAMTAYTMPGDKEEFLDAGMDDYLAKPVDIKDIPDVLSRLSNVL